MIKHLTTSLLISTYNWPEALYSCLQSILCQKLLPTEIIICDDGSTNSTKKIIYEFIKICPIKVQHIWHPDEGFKLAQIRNKGIAASSGDYIIQIDGDLVLHNYFIHDHIQFAKRGYFCTGSRVLLNPSQTQATIDLQEKPAQLAKNFFNGLRVPILRTLLASRYKQNGKHKYYVKGCNMAFWKKDLVMVNGYNEDFTGWGKEDSELAIRLINAGIKKRFIKFGGITYHLYHKEASKVLEARNHKLMEDSIQQKLISAENGLNKYL